MCNYGATTLLVLALLLVVIGSVGRYRQGEGCTLDSCKTKPGITVLACVPVRGTAQGLDSRTNNYAGGTVRSALAPLACCTRCRQAEVPCGKGIPGEVVCGEGSLGALVLASCPCAWVFGLA